MSATNANVPPPVASGTARSPAAGIPSKFQDLYQNLPAMQNQSDEDAQQADSKSTVVKKKSPSGDVASTIAATPATWNNATLPNATATLALSLGLASQPAHIQSHQPQSDSATGHTSDPALSPIPQSTPVSGVATKLVGASSPAVVAGNTEQSQAQNLGLQKPSTIQTLPVAEEQKQPLLNPRSASQPASGTPSSTASASPMNRDRAADSKTPDAVGVQIAPAPGPRTMPAPSPSITPTSASPSASIPAPAASQPKSDEQLAEPQVSPARTSSDPVTATSPEQSFPLSTGNLAFTMQLAEATGQPDALADPEAETRSTGNSAISTPSAKPSTTTGGQPAAEIMQPAAGSEPRTAAAVPAAPSAGPSRSLPNATDQPGYASHSASAPEARDSGKSSSQESMNSAKPESTAHEQAPSDSSSPAQPVTVTHSSSTLYQALTNSAAGLGAVAHIDAAPAINLSDQPSPALSAAAPPAQPQPLNLVPPRTNPSNEILLNLGNGQSSAAVRVVDRAGTVTVSVHASDQDLRNSLRANLNDLTTQLSAQGVKTEVLKTASTQSTPESRQEQGNPQQRGSGQQHSLSQNDRQSQRERRGNSQWLEELAEQTSASTVQPGGKNS